MPLALAAVQVTCTDATVCLRVCRAGLFQVLLVDIGTDIWTAVARPAVNGTLYQGNSADPVFCTGILNVSNQVSCQAPGLSA